MSRNDCEQCEIRVNRLPVLGGFVGSNFEFVAEARGGPDGTYIVARTPEFAPFELTLKNKVLKVFETNPAEPDDIEWTRGFLNLLVNFLVRVRWEPLGNSGAKWYSYSFERPLSLYIPDPDPSSMSYTIGDTEISLKKALDLAKRYQRQRDFTSCREAGKALMQYGIALERERRFFEAGPIYTEAKKCFESLSLPDEAESAIQARFRCTMLDVKFKMGY